MTSTQLKTRPATEERPAAAQKASPLWVGNSIAVLVVVVVLRGLSRAGYLTDGLLHQWYVQVGLCLAGVAAYSLLFLVVRKAYRRR